ncbi:hypothetical protein RAAC3_TM7C00001G0745 [Candidatus Saccharibacteria bacterium RAAC3_TM7_1]|nr:hypothetical protein RAAC3_TM7C00001G0745 [Candidatus Saccharibacteria bacterium RAAC3_TM7_1]HCZ28548.1 hypothetical protein [Candidatus Saccharibacteria bacterium]
MKSLSLTSPHAIVMVGIPGSGKTFFAHKFAETFNAPYLDQAYIEKNVDDAKKAAEVTDHFLHQLLKTNQSIVLEVESDTRQARTLLAKTLRAAGYIPLFVWVQVDAPTARQRSLKARQMTAQEFDQRTERFSAPHHSEQPLVISGKHTYASQAKLVLKKLSAPRAEISAHSSAPIRGRIVVR